MKYADAALGILVVVLIAETAQQSEGGWGGGCTDDWRADRRSCTGWINKNGPCGGGGLEGLSCDDIYHDDPCPESAGGFASGLDDSFEWDTTCRRMIAHCVDGMCNYSPEEVRVMHCSTPSGDRCGAH